MCSRLGTDRDIPLLLNLFIDCGCNYLCPWSAFLSSHRPRRQNCAGNVVEWILHVTFWMVFIIMILWVL